MFARTRVRIAMIGVKRSSASASNSTPKLAMLMAKKGASLPSVWVAAFTEGT